MKSAPPEVELLDGRLRGRSDGRVMRFLGVPYAAAPMGVLRLREAQQAPKWNGLRDAGSYGPTAPKGAYHEALQPLLPEITIPGAEWLNLNVWAPVSAADDSAVDRPVLVWIHGGAFLNGSGSLAEYDGTAFARDGVVCVTVNYRLGAEGSLIVPDRSVPDSLGARDVIAALRWIHANIAHFGGDPARVTVAGQSAGAMMVAALLASPDASGLFAAAVLQSTPNDPVATRSRTSEVSERLADRFGVTCDRDGLARVSPQRLADGSTALAKQLRDEGRGGPSVPFAPSIGDVVRSVPLEAARAGEIDVPVLVGTTRDESELFFRPLGLEDAEASAVNTERGFRRPAVDLGRALAAAGKPVWLYRFDGVDPRENSGLGSCHASDLPFVFDTVNLPGLSPRIGRSPSRAAVATTHGAWVAFCSAHQAPWSEFGRTGVTALLADEVTETILD